MENLIQHLPDPPNQSSKNTDYGKKTKEHQIIKSIHSKGSKHQLKKETLVLDFVKIQNKTFVCINV